MRKLIYLSLMVLAVTFVSCSDDDGDTLYQSYGVVKEDINSTNKFYVRTDKGHVLIPTTSILKVEDIGKRVWMAFTTDDDVNADTIRTKVYDFLRITQVNIQTGGLDTLSNDRVKPEKYWVAQNYLTMHIPTYASSEYDLEKHKWYMYSGMDIVNDTLNMELRYDNNRDNPYRIFNKVIAVPLNGINPEKEIVIAVKYKYEDSTDKTIYLEYKPEE